MFSIGVTEKRLAGLRLSFEPDAINKIAEDAKKRREKQVPPKVQPAAKRMENLRWHTRAATDEMTPGHGFLVDPSLTADAVRTFHSKLIGETYRKRISKGNHKVSGVRGMGPTRKAVHATVLKANQARLGLPSVSLLSEVNAIVDRTRPAWGVRRPTELVGDPPAGRPAQGAVAASASSDSASGGAAARSTSTTAPRTGKGSKRKKKR
jgi:hypothetical protein